MCLWLSWHWFNNRCNPLPSLRLLNFTPNVGKNQMNSKPFYLSLFFILLTWGVFLLLRTCVDEKKEYGKETVCKDSLAVRMKHCPLTSHTYRGPRISLNFGIRANSYGWARANCLEKEILKSLVMENPLQVLLSCSVLRLILGCKEKWFSLLWIFLASATSSLILCLYTWD